MTKLWKGERKEKRQEKCMQNIEGNRGEQQKKKRN